jgi:hypothetical protein
LVTTRLNRATGSGIGNSDPGVDPGNDLRDDVGALGLVEDLVTKPWIETALDARHLTEGGG